MKRTTILIAAVLFTAISNYSFGGSINDSLKTNTERAFKITTLVINADVTVVLVNNNEAMLEATGGKSFRKFIRLEKNGDTLVINSNKTKNFYDGTVYVPASELRRIQVNSNAHVRSLFALQIPNLDVIINGACDFAISNVGEVNVTGTENFSVEQDRLVRTLPSSFRKRKD